jgi:Holliday junction resolvasome RuvABC endonuclease subunit
MNPPRKYAPTMSVYMNSRGFAFVLFEGTLSPYDWGVLEIRGGRKHQQIMNKVTSLLHRYTPDVLVMQDMGPDGTRRANRLAVLNSALGSVAIELGIPVFTYSRLDVYDAFRSMGFANKQMLAALIAKHIPAFERHVPPPRKAWMSEDARMGLFDAAALALIFFQKANNLALPHPEGLLPESRP